MMKRLVESVKKRPVRWSFAFSLALGFLLGAVRNCSQVYYYYYTPTDYVVRIAQGILFDGIGFSVFLAYPLLLTLLNLLGLCVPYKSDGCKKAFRRFAHITLVLGTLYSGLFMLITSSKIVWDAEWSEQLYNDQLHQPIWSQGLLTVLILSTVGVIGYFVLSLTSLEKLPPLVIVLSMSAMYIGAIECVLWIIQMVRTDYWLLCLLPVNCILIAAKTVRCKISEWNAMRQQAYRGVGKNRFLNFLNRKCARAALWPVAAFVLMWPLLGLVLCVLMLLGQRPDSIIKSWTETAQWQLSEHTAPPNLFKDEHYLCTVAAGGHRSIVKPLRMGERHGHRVVVNRQLCIANAFEQILEEKTPNLHKRVRHLYDTYGFPVAKHIRTKRAADLVYWMMKPLEWAFLAVLYLCDAQPENRIAVQYLPMPKDQAANGAEGSKAGWCCPCNGETPAKESV